VHNSAFLRIALQKLFRASPAMSKACIYTDEFSIRKIVIGDFARINSHNHFFSLLASLCNESKHCQEEKGDCDICKLSVG